MIRIKHAVLQKKKKTTKPQTLNITEMYNLQVSYNFIPYNYCLNFNKYYEKFTFTLVFFWRIETVSLRKEENTATLKSFPLPPIWKAHNVNFLALIIYYSCLKSFGESGWWEHRTLLYYFYNFFWVYNYLKIKS